MIYILLTIKDFLLNVLSMGIYGEQCGRQSSRVTVVHEEKIAYALGDYPSRAYLEHVEKVEEASHVR